ncbi:BatA domain-containing protein [Rubripirellula amarantea]|nr:BatA domain-containing protein [Rubripirellula amarantea]
MSFLAPLYLLGGLAIALPILFHLIRRTPKSDLTFSSLMFLEETPPKLTRRSRLDHLPLLLLRILALALLAIAFARPLLRSATTVPLAGARERVVIVIDTSASMKRNNLWSQATEKLRSILKKVDPQDELALIAFDSLARPIIGFESEMSTTEKCEYANLIIDDKTLSPSWHSTDLSQALQLAADIASEETAERSVSTTTRIVLISDLQSGSNSSQLQGYAWPENVAVDAVGLSTPASTNASAEILVSNRDFEQTDQNDVRVRVTNAKESAKSQFAVAWDTASGNTRNDLTTAIDVDALNNALPVQVLPGQSRIVRMPIATPPAECLILSGDDHSFDNRWYITKPKPTNQAIWFYGKTSDRPKQAPYFFLSQVPLGDSIHQIKTELVQTWPASGPPNVADVPVIILSEPLTLDSPVWLQDYMTEGGRIIVLLTKRDQQEAMTQSVRTISGDESFDVREAELDEYAMMSEIDFSSPLFAPLDDPKFNDFTKVRFWSTREILEFDDQWHTLAAFDTQAPAILSRKVGKGSLFVLASSWHPDESQLALSSKFVPMMNGLLRAPRDSSSTSSFFVGDTGDQYTEPGVYEKEDGTSVAINLHPSESDTTPLEVDWLDRLNVPIWDTNDSISDDTSPDTPDAERQLRDRELESSQSLWRLLLIVALGILGIETILAKVQTRQA